MNALTRPTALPELAEITGSRGLSLSYSVELRKLAAQTGVRLLALVCLLGPFAYAVVLSIQSGAPADSLFGFWVHTSGFAISLTLLSFAGAYAFPLIAGIVAGDMFSSEDRHGTWKTILTRSCTREDIFVAKVLAAASVVIGLSLVIAATSLLAGFVTSGAHPLVNLSGQLTGAWRMLALTIVAWLYCLLPVLAYVSLAILFSIATRSGILGVLGPVVVTLATQLLDLVGKGITVHMLLIGGAFDGWHGLFTSRPFLGPLAISVGVCVVWIVVCLGVSWRIVRRRDFLAGSDPRGANWVTPLVTVAATIATVAVLAVACAIGPTGVTARRVAASVGAAFNRLTLYQQSLIGRSAPPNAHFDVQPQCNRRAAASVGPGDWNCNLYVYMPQLKRGVPYQVTAVEYEVSVSYNGCWKADSPPAFVGGQTMPDRLGRQVANPLFTAYGCFNIL